MIDRERRDAARRIANVAGALFQIAGGGLGLLLASVDVGRVSDENRTLVVPAGYAFAIWGPIFGLCLAYAVYQALPARRADPALRRIGWWTAGAFLGSGVWGILFPYRRFVLAQLLIVAIAVCAVATLLRLATATPGGGSRIERWLIAPTLGLLAGWLTAATLVGLATTLVARGWAADGAGAALGGGALLLLGGGIGAVVIALPRAGPPAGWLAYGAATLWALAAVVVNRYDDSLVTSGAAAAWAALVVVALAGDVPQHRPAWRDRGGPSPAPPPEVPPE